MRCYNFCTKYGFVEWCTYIEDTRCQLWVRWECDDTQSTQFCVLCILVCSTPKMATWVAETCLWPPCNTITYIKSSVFFRLLIYFMHLINARNMEHIKIIIHLWNKLLLPKNVLGSTQHSPSWWLTSSEISKKHPPFIKSEGQFRIHISSLHYHRPLVHTLSLRQTADRTWIFGGIFEENSNCFISGVSYEKTAFIVQIWTPLQFAAHIPPSQLNFWKKSVTWRGLFVQILQFVTSFRSFSSRTGLPSDWVCA